MAEKSHIAWTSHTASPWFGCTEVSPGCANCYARELTLNHKWAGWGDKSPRVLSKGFWKEAYKWNARAGLELNKPTAFPKSRPRIFTSLMDWLDPQVPVEWLVDFLKVVHDCQSLDWLLLTKRPELWRERLCAAGPYLTNGFPVNWLHEGVAPPNVWFGVTVENQAMADKRIPILLSIPAKVRWLSVEPLLEAVLLDGLHRTEGNTYPKLDWVVVGGESGSKRRDCGVEAIVNVAEQCKAAGVPIFVKQDAAWKPGKQGRIPDHIWAMKEFPK